MNKQFAKLDRIDYNEAITDEFIDFLQCALLLALREQGVLNVMQHRRAQERFVQQRRSCAGKILEKGES